MSSMFTPKQRDNIRLGYHPDCCITDPCPACGASEAPGGGGCPGQIQGLPSELWNAAVRHDHNADPQRVLMPSHVNDAALMDRAARALATPSTTKEPQA